MLADANKSYYHDYFLELPCFVSVQDRNLTIIDANRKFLETFGQKLGQRCWEVYKGRMLKCGHCPVEQTFLTGQPQSAEEVLTALDGRQVPVYVHTAPIVGADGTIERVVEISTDITPVKKLQNKLHKTQQQLQQFFDEVPCYVTIQDRNYRLVASNRLFKRDFGNDSETTCYEAYKHREEPCLECPVMKTFEDGQSHQSEEVVTSMSGERYNVLVSTAPLRDSQGEITQVVEISTNITCIRQLQDQLASLGLLVGSISHGIKSLISGLDGGMYLMESGLEKNDRSRIDRGWDLVSRNVGQIRKMVYDILYYTKDREMQFETCPVSDFARDLASSMHGKASRFRVELQSTIPEDAGTFSIDHAAMTSALSNIIENSFDACRKDVNKTEHRVGFSVEPDHSSDDIRIVIEDNGLGMDRETQEKIFSLFFSSKGNEGTGLGLFIANKIICKHGGTITVSSVMREGTRFVVSLPRQQHTPDQNTPPTKAASTDNGDDDPELSALADFYRQP